MAPQCLSGIHTCQFWHGSSERLSTPNLVVLMAHETSLDSNIRSFDMAHETSLDSHILDWAIKMRIRPPEFETSICDVKYHVSLALSVIPRGSWGDVARRFTIIRWVSPKMWFRSRKCCEPMASCIPEPLRLIFSLPLLSSPRRRRPAVATHRRRTCFDCSGEEIPSVKYSSCLLVQIGEEIGILVVDRIRRPTQPTVEVPISS
ncbi:inactive leucine-rich repeat receptor-like protein kinase-like [Dorcoceras hygrometricum]|uniref:Inactive leucine-rich repeat receptor-like protein kinase-like n=1 Tax=Dorcoceras hygrometricum TaxID=472368 RepID=A0A2Z7ANN7_9LAMI|nr:inactive leucine-rich repeat receptor-like protein kinase-like [Dorcoceras hygrometricum]